MSVINGLDDMTYNFTTSVVIFQPHRIAELVRYVAFNDDVGFKRVINELVKSSKNFDCYRFYPPKSFQLKKAIQGGHVFRFEYFTEMRNVRLSKEIAEITSEFNFKFR